LFVFIFTIALDFTRQVLVFCQANQLLRTNLFAIAFFSKSDRATATIKSTTIFFTAPSAISGSITIAGVKLAFAANIATEPLWL